MYILLGNRSSEGDGEVSESKFSIFSLMRSLFEYGALSTTMIPLLKNDVFSVRVTFMFKPRDLLPSIFKLFA